MDVRNFFTPALDYDDIGKAELLLKIETVEDFVEATYFNDSTTTSTLVRIPCLLLIASKIISSPSLSKEYGFGTIKKEVLGDYAYELALSATTSKDGTSVSPHLISKTWERMALDMLEARSEDAGNRYKFGLWKSND